MRQALPATPVSSRWSTGTVAAAVDQTLTVLAADGTHYRLKYHPGSPAWSAECKEYLKVDAKIYFREPNADALIDTVITEQGKVITLI